MDTANIIDLVKLLGTEELEPVVFRDMRGNEHTIPGRKFGIGKAFSIIQLFLSVADIIHFKTHWNEAVLLTEQAVEQYHRAMGQLGPVPPVKTEEYVEYYKRWSLVPTPPPMTKLLQDRLVPELFDLVQQAPEIAFKIMAYAISDEDKIEEHAKAGTLKGYIEEQSFYVQHRLDVDAMMAIFGAIFRFVGLETFFKRLGDLRAPRTTQEETTTNESDESGETQDKDEKTRKGAKRKQTSSETSELSA